MPSDVYLKQIRSLTIALFLSGALNVLLIAFLFFWSIRDRPPTPYCELKPKEQYAKQKPIAASPTNSNLLRTYKALPYDQLLLKLNKTGLVEDGFTERDLALAVLVGFYDFDLEHALGNTPLQKRLLSFGEGQDRVFIFPGISDEQYEKLYTFTKTEKWPFKSRGLFYFLKKEQYQDDDSLKEAFYLTQEFNAVEMLFKGKEVARQDLIYLIQEGDWGLLSAFTEKQKAVQDLSDENRERLLLSYLKVGSPTSALLLLKTDYDFASKRLSDPTVMAIVRLLNENTSDAQRFLTAVAASPRGDQAKSLAIAKYQELTGKVWEPLVSRETPIAKPLAIEKSMPFKPVLAKPIPAKPIAQTPAMKMQPVKKEILYIVQDKDSLWKIAKRFKVSIEDLRKINKLSSDFLKPGTALKVPVKGQDHSRPDAKGGNAKSVLR